MAGGAVGNSTAGTAESRGTGLISASVPEQLKMNSYDEIIKQLERRRDQYKPLTDEQLEKLRKRQKAEGMLSGISDAVRSVANLAFTHHYAPDMYDSSKSMSARAKARFDKEKADREAEEDRWLNYSMTISKLKDADNDRKLRLWQTEQTLARQDRDRDDNIAFRNKDFDERLRQWQLNFDRQGEWHKEEGERWERQFKESVKQFYASNANERARINLESQRLAHSIKEGQMTFNLGSGNGNVTLTLDKLNAETISHIYSTLPADVRSQVQGDPIYAADINEKGEQQYDFNGKPLQKVIGYKPPTTEAMLIAIGANVESSPATQNAIKQVAGLETGEKPAGY
ncbi:MAG: hypothetical protein K2I56_07745 [Muribaculaceae bacterium]|nr:hypothetical protein [Muribaculaceae bacterium]